MFGSCVCVCVGGKSIWKLGLGVGKTFLTPTLFIFVSWDFRGWQEGSLFLFFYLLIFFFLRISRASSSINGGVICACGCGLLGVC